MAIQPPSDILLDVANAADPVAVRAATARLAALAASPGVSNAGFAEALGQAAKSGRSPAPGPGPLPPSAKLAALPSPVGGVHREARSDHADVYRKFEAVLLQTFVESMLPKDSELFGDKESAGVYRSMMAERLADEISKAGGIGIAKSIGGRHPPAHPPAAPAPSAEAADTKAGPAGAPA